MYILKQNGTDRNNSSFTPHRLRRNKARYHYLIEELLFIM